MAKQHEFAMLLNRFALQFLCALTNLGTSLHLANMNSDQQYEELWQYLAENYEPGELIVVWDRAGRTEGPSSTAC